MQGDNYPGSRSIILSLGWFASGTMWFLQALVPWTAAGSLSRSSTIEAASLIRSGAVASLAPAAAGWLLVALPAIGVIVGATAFTQHRAVRYFRGSALIFAVIVSAVLTHYLTDFETSNFGPGALLAWLGCATFLTTVAASALTRPAS